MFLLLVLREATQVGIFSSEVVILPVRVLGKLGFTDSQVNSLGVEELAEVVECFPVVAFDVGQGGFSLLLFAQGALQQVVGQEAIGSGVEDGCCLALSEHVGDLLPAPVELILREGLLIFVALALLTALFEAENSDDVEQFRGALVHYLFNTGELDRHLSGVLLVPVGGCFLVAGNVLPGLGHVIEEHSHHLMNF